MKLWIVLALVGMVAAAPYEKNLGIAIKKFCPVLQAWVVEKYITDPEEIARIAAEQADTINVINVKDESEIKCNTGDIIGGPAPALVGPEVVLPCAEFHAPAQTKVVQRKPCFRGYAPIEIDVDGQKWKCTHIGRTRSPCLPAGRVVDRACTKTINQPEYVIIDKPCEEENVVDPCSLSVSSTSSSSHDVKIVQEPCEVKVVEPCPEDAIVEPCEFKLPEIKLSASASASASVSACDVDANASTKLDVNSDPGTVLGKGSLTSSFSGSISASASASASASHSSSSSTSFSL